MGANLKDSTYGLLLAIRDGKKHTLSSRVLAPLARAGILEIEHKPNGMIKGAKLSEWGKTVLSFEEKERTPVTRKAISEALDLLFADDKWYDIIDADQKLATFHYGGFRYTGRHGKNAFRFHYKNRDPNMGSFVSGAFFDLAHREGGNGERLKGAWIKEAALDLVDRINRIK
jgi:hypothetical protein